MSINRHEFILDRLEIQGACSYQELAGLLGVSAMTVRREVDRLADRGLVIKTLGGAQRTTAPASHYEADHGARASANVPQKQAIAAVARRLIDPGQTVYLDPSTTCLELARKLGGSVEEFSAVTNSALACLELGRARKAKVVGIGGQFDRASGSFVGPASEEWADRFFVDRAFVSTKGFLPEEGTFESAIETIRVKQAIARRCSELVLLADSSKFGLRALCKALDIGQIRTVVTDPGVTDDDRKRLERIGVRVMVAEVTESRQSEGTDAA